MAAMLTALSSLINHSMELNLMDQADAVFECIEMMIHCSHQEGRGTDCIYSSKTISKVVGICLKL